MDDVLHSEIDEIQPPVLVHNGLRYCLYEDSGYNSFFIEIPFQRATLSLVQWAFNKAMSAVRISMDGVFK